MDAYLKTQHVGQKVEIFLCHYAMRVWNKSHWNVPHLYGHSHGNLPSQGLSFDIGVDCHNYFPVSMKRVLLKFQEMYHEQID